MDDAGLVSSTVMTARRMLLLSGHPVTPPAGIPIGMPRINAYVNDYQYQVAVYLRHMIRSYKYVENVGRWAPTVPLSSRKCH